MGAARTHAHTHTIKKKSSWIRPRSVSVRPGGLTAIILPSVIDGEKREARRRKRRRHGEEGSISHREAGAKCELAVAPVVLPACRDVKLCVVGQVWVGGASYFRRMGAATHHASVGPICVLLCLNVTAPILAGGSVICAPIVTEGKHDFAC